MLWAKNCRYQTSPTACNPTPFANDNRLIQRLESSVYPYRVNASAWTSPIRNEWGLGLLGTFSTRIAPSSSGIVTYT